ncbi:MAG: hypothetical protein V7L29_28525 [Nostoc sp.]
MLCFEVFYKAIAFALLATAFAISAMPKAGYAYAFAISTTAFFN